MLLFPSTIASGASWVVSRVVLRKVCKPLGASRSVPDHAIVCTVCCIAYEQSEPAPPRAPVKQGSPTSVGIRLVRPFPFPLVMNPLWLREKGFRFAGL